MTHGKSKSVSTTPAQNKVPRGRGSRLLTTSQGLPGPRWMGGRASVAPGTAGATADGRPPDPAVGTALEPGLTEMGRRRTATSHGLATPSRRQRASRITCEDSDTHRVWATAQGHSDGGPKPLPTSPRSLSVLLPVCFPTCPYNVKRQGLRHHVPASVGLALCFSELELVGESPGRGVLAVKRHPLIRFLSRGLKFWVN